MNEFLDQFLKLVGLIVILGGLSVGVGVLLGAVSISINQNKDREDEE